MKFTCYFCASFLVILGIFGGVYAFSGYNLLLAATFGITPLYRAALALGFVCALFTIYSMIVFKPFKGLK